MSRLDKFKLWLKVIYRDLKAKPIVYLAGFLIGLSLLLSSITATQSLELAQKIEGEVIERREDACVYAEYQAQREKEALIHTVERLVSPSEIESVIRVINEEYDKIPPSSLCFDNDSIPEDPGNNNSR